MSKESLEFKERSFFVGDIVRHFKYELMSEEEKARNPRMHMYEVLGFATHTETDELLVIYKALYAPFDTFARPADMFLSEVDHEKYPNIKQQFRLEKVEGQ